MCTLKGTSFTTFSFAFSGSRECAYSTANTVSCETRVYDINTRGYSYQKKIHRLDCQRVRWQVTTFNPTISSNQRSKQKHRKNNMSIWSARLRVKGASKPTSWIFTKFSGPLVTATALTLLLESFVWKKTIQSQHFS